MEIQYVNAIAVPSCGKYIGTQACYVAGEIELVSDGV